MFPAHCSPALPSPTQLRLTRGFGCKLLPKQPLRCGEYPCYPTCPSPDSGHPPTSLHHTGGFPTHAPPRRHSMGTSSPHLAPCYTPAPMPRADLAPVTHRALSVPHSSRPLASLGCQAAPPGLCPALCSLHHPVCNEDLTLPMAQAGQPGCLLVPSTRLCSTERPPSAHPPVSPTSCPPQSCRPGAVDPAPCLPSPQSHLNLLGPIRELLATCGY